MKEEEMMSFRRVPEMMAAAAAYYREYSRRST